MIYQTHYLHSFNPIRNNILVAASLDALIMDKVFCKTSQCPLFHSMAKRIIKTKIENLAPPVCEELIPKRS